MAFSVLLLLSWALVDVLYAQTALNLIQCKTTDEACVTETIKAAFPLILQPNNDIGAVEMDPMFVELIEGHQPGLNYKLINNTITGMKSCNVQSAKYLDDKGEMLHIDILCQKIRMDGFYDGKGQLMTMHVEGNGEYTVQSNKYSVSMDLEVKPITKKGKSYNTIKSFKFKAEPLEKVTFDPKNLFNGQKDLADEVIKFANDRWREVMFIIQDPLILEFTKKIVKNANKYLKHIPIDEYQSP